MFYFRAAWLLQCDVYGSASLRTRPTRLQAVQNAAVRLIAGARKIDHVTPLLRERHWLPVKQRITFKVAVMTYKCVHGTTADYLADYIRPLSSATANLHLRSTSSCCPFVPPSKTAAGTDHLQLLVHVKVRHCGWNLVANIYLLLLIHIYMLILAPKLFFYILHYTCWAMSNLLCTSS